MQAEASQHSREKAREAGGEAFLKRIAIVLITIGLVGCATSETVYLQNAVGQKVQCGPYTDYGNIPSANVTTQAQLRDCIADYQRQGYERIPTP